MGSWDDLGKALIAANSGAQQLIAADDPYLKFKQAPDLVTGLTLKAAGTGKYKMKELIAAALASGLTSGFAEGLSDDYQGRAMDAAGDVLSGKATERPDVLSRGLFKRLSNQKELFGIQRQYGQMERAQDREDAVVKGYLGEGAKIHAQNDTWKEINGEAPTVAAAAQGGEVAPGAAAVVPTVSAVDPTKFHPDSPQYKGAVEERKRQDQIFGDVQTSLEKGPLAMDFRDRDQNLQVMLANIKDDSTAADLAIINGFQRVNDPGVSVRGEDVKTIREGQAYLTAKYGDIRGWFTDEGRLKPQYRAALARSAINTVNAVGANFQKFADQRLAQTPRAKEVAYSPFTPYNVGDYVSEIPEENMGAAQYSREQAKAAGYSDADINALVSKGVLK